MKKFLIISFLTVFLAYSGSALANGFGLTLDQPAGDYIANVDYDAVNGIFTGAPVQFAFQLFNKDRSKTINFTEAWVTVAPSGVDTSYVPPVFDGGLTGSNSGFIPSGMTFTFPKSGDYDMNIRYDQDGKTLAEAKFKLTVTGGGGQSAGTTSGYLPGAILGIIGTLIVIGAIFMFRRKKATY